MNTAKRMMSAVWQNNSMQADPVNLAGKVHISLFNTYRFTNISVLAITLAVCVDRCLKRSRIGHCWTDCKVLDLSVSESVMTHATMTLSNIDLALVY